MMIKSVKVLNLQGDELLNIDNDDGDSRLAGKIKDDLYLIKRKDGDGNIDSWRFPKTVVLKQEHEADG